MVVDSPLRLARTAAVDLLPMLADAAVLTALHALQRPTASEADSLHRPARRLAARRA